MLSSELDGARRERTECDWKSPTQRSIVRQENDIRVITVTRTAVLSLLSQNKLRESSGLTAIAPIKSTEVMIIRSD